ncbi:restriction endonuclease [Desulfosporosinus acidiphilus SJ4]|uniref:Putative HNH nuclease YajD n=1 Tax=Desulfosporosinus acidiphilus (strain DSM 22704 / JCM 16185 / SJ4) TaxID=646529 RepID=I4D3E1_DESAJ|nr:HNH endonuclease [Desulfosporosinus acidiphilus]AFM40315.1 restriction endonuclease [Desulfosporosinus acidiphilus SJ4]
MPTKPKRPCSYPGCPWLTAGRYCEQHQKQVSKEYDLRRGSAASRGYDSRWATTRKRYLREHSLCVECLKTGKLTPANVVDHVIPHKGDMVKFWDESNWQSLCKRCHDRKTAKEDGRWG